MEEDKIAEIFARAGRAMLQSTRSNNEIDGICHITKAELAKVVAHYKEGDKPWCITSFNGCALFIEQVVVTDVFVEVDATKINVYYRCRLTTKDDGEIYRQGFEEGRLFPSREALIAFYYGRLTQEYFSIKQEQDESK